MKKRLTLVLLALSTLTLSILALSTLAVAQLELLPDSVVEYTASDPSNSWSGRAPVARLTFSLDPDDVRAAQLSVTVQPGQFDSGNFIRDANARRVVFETGEYPDITFELADVQAPRDSLGDGEALELTLAGTLTMHGVRREVTTKATFSRSGATYAATGAFMVDLSDYDMKRPSFFGVEVDDPVRVAFDVRARAP